MQSRQERLTLANCRLFDGERWHGDARYRITLAGERIISVDLDPAIETDRSAFEEEPSVVDLNGMTVMPGLIDAHFHCNSPSLDPRQIDGFAPSLLAQHARRHLENALSKGFTTVRDAGGADPGLVAAIEQGLIDGPRLFIAGKALSQTGGRDDFTLAFNICDCATHIGYLSQVVDGPDEIRKLVRTHLRAGVDHIKIFVSSGVLSPTDPIWTDQFTDDEITAAVEEAARRRTYVMAHAVSKSSIRRCARLGVRSIEHGLDMDDETAELVADAGAYIVPTLSAHHGLVHGEVALPTWAREKARSVADLARHSVQTCAEKGVAMGLGTDLFGDLQSADIDELQLRAAIDGPLSALRSATSINARILMREGQLGAIAPGAFADLLIVDGDPVSNITLLAPGSSAVRGIIKGGRIVRRRPSLPAPGTRPGERCTSGLG